LVVLDAPGSTPFPIPGIIPAFPVLLELPAGYPFMVPSVSVPIVVSVVSSPARIHIIIKPWDVVEVNPTVVVITGTIPAAFPRTPPPAIPEINVYIDIRDNVRVVRIGYHDHSRRFREYDGGRQGKSYVYIDLCLGRERNDNRQ
jgi:hypothetical protein